MVQPLKAVKSTFRTINYSLFVNVQSVYANVDKLQCIANFQVYPTHNTQLNKLLVIIIKTIRIGTNHKTLV